MIPGQTKFGVSYTAGLALIAICMLLWGINPIVVAVVIAAFVGFGIWIVRR